MAIKGNKQAILFYDPGRDATYEISLDNYEKFLQDSTPMKEEDIVIAVEEAKNEVKGKIAGLLGADAQKLTLTEDEEKFTIEVQKGAVE